MAKARPLQPDVETLVNGMQHPRKADLLALCAAVLAVSPRVSEGIKWNSPSFRTTEWFATVNTHGRDSIRLILHRGARARKDVLKRDKIVDPDGLLKWLGPDRAMIEFPGAVSPPQVKALRAIVRQWIKHV